MYYIYILFFILIEIKIRYVIKEIGKVWSFPKSIWNALFLIKETGHICKADKPVTTYIPKFPESQG